MRRLASMHRCLLQWGTGVTGAERNLELAKTSSLNNSMVIRPVLNFMKVGLTGAIEIFPT